MLVLTGALLVLVTWGLVIAGLAIIGAPLSALSHRHALSWTDVRRGLWWGLTLAAILVMVVSPALPLGSRWVLVGFLGLVILGGAATLLLVRHRGWVHVLVWRGSTFIVLVMAGAAVIYLAVAALGPVTNFDSGLYHLTAISVARDIGAVPGLANLHAPLGYANASFPMAAALGSGPWGTEGFRLLNGLVIVAVLTDLVGRWAERRRTAGAYGLLVGSVVLVVPMVALSDYWVTSPSQDSAVFAVTVAASAMVMNAVARSRERYAELSTALVASVLLVLLRPTMGAYAGGILVVGVILAARSTRATPGVREWRRPLLLVVVFALAGALAQVIRDYVLSGWLLYPLSIWNFDVDWRAVDPVGLRTATLGYHRDPTDLWNAAEGWSWAGPWLGRLPAQWETWLVIVLLATAVGTALYCRHVNVTIRWRPMVLAMVPSILMVMVWWTVTPPSFRFAWGPLFTTLTIPIGWMLWRACRTFTGGSGHRRETGVASAAGTLTLVVVAFCAVARLDVASIDAERTWTLGLRVPFAVAPVAESKVTAVDLGRGLVVDVPDQGFACWDVSPLCTPEPDGQVGFRDPSVGIAGGLKRG